jgi:hypothetical protein
VLLPLCIPASARAATLTFALSISAYVTPAVLGPSGPNFLATLIYQNFINLYEWGIGSTLALLLLASALVVVLASASLHPVSVRPGGRRREGSPRHRRDPALRLHPGAHDRGGRDLVRRQRDHGVPAADLDAAVVLAGHREARVSQRRLEQHLDRGFRRRDCLAHRHSGCARAGSGEHSRAELVQTALLAPLVVPSIVIGLSILLATARFEVPLTESSCWRRTCSSRCPICFGP